MNGRTGDPYARFADMPDEDIVGLANTENNVLAQEYLLHKYRNFVRGTWKGKKLFSDRSGTGRYHSGRNDRLIQSNP